MNRRTLEGSVALVAGGSRGAGRGIAVALGAEGATVIVTGRSTERRPSPDAPGTIEATAREVSAAGGRGIAIACDHTSKQEVAALIERIRDEHGRLDVVVSSVWGGNERDLFSRPFWEQPLENRDATMGAGVRSHLTTATLAAPLMMERRTGLIAVVSFDDDGAWLGNLFYDLPKAAMNRLAFGIGRELEPYGITSVALSPGHMRTERVVASGVDLAGTESTLYVGRAVAALAIDPHRQRWNGRILHVAMLARTYGFTDEDGTQPPRFRIHDDAANPNAA